MLRPIEALALVALSLVALIIASPLVTGPATLIGVEVGIVFLPAFLVARIRRVPLAMTSTSARSLVSAVLLGGGACYLMMLFESLVLERITPTPPAVKESLRRLIIPPEGLRPLALDLVAFSFAPAICEETLFRGVVFDAFGRGARAVIFSALLFGAFHFSPYRLIPAALLGLVIGALRWRTRSLWSAILFHATNNALVLIAVRHGHDDPWPLSTPRGVLFALASLGVVLLGAFFK